MNLMEQHEQVIKEINAYYSFLRRIQFHNFLRIFKPHYQIGYQSRIIGPELRALFSRKKHRDKLKLWAETLDLLSSETEKTSPYYEIIRSDSFAIDHLCEYLANTFSDYNWVDLEKANQVRENVLPKFGFAKVVMGGLTITAILTIFKGLWDGSLWSLVQQKLIQENQSLLIAMLYVVLLVLIFSFSFWRRRVRLQRAGNILKYMTILYPTERRCKNEAG